MTNPSLFLLFLAAAGISGYLLASLINTSGKKASEGSERYPTFYPGHTAIIQASENRSKNGLAILPFIFILFICSMFYVLYNFNNKLNDLEEGQITQQIETDKFWNGQKERGITVVGQKGAQPKGVYYSVAFNGGWGIELINDQSSLRWLEEYERALYPFLTKDRTLLVETIVNDNETIDHHFYLGPFDTREDAISIKERLSYLSPEAKIVPLKDIDNLQAFQVQTPGA